MQRSFLRIAPYVAICLLGFAIVLAIRSAPPGPRLAGRANLVSLIERADAHSRVLRDQMDLLQERLTSLEAAAAERQSSLAGVRARIDELASFAGLSEVDGPGVVVELRDSTLRRSPTGDPNDLVIHERDLQAVVNALWAGGAEAIAINGERLTATSAVRCVGNTLLLHGTVYAPPYRVEAVGLPAALLRGLDEDREMERLRISAEVYKLSVAVSTADRLRLPAYRGVVDMRRARIV